MQTSSPQFRGIMNSICEILPRILIESPKESSLIELLSSNEQVMTTTTIGEHHGKYCRIHIGKYACVDVNESVLNKNETKWYERTKTHAITIRMDLSSQTLLSSTHQNMFHHAACYSLKMEQAFHSEHSAKIFMNNVSSLLKPNGYLFGICLDTSTIWTMFQKELSRNIVSTSNRSALLKRSPYTLKLNNLNSNCDDFELFGTSYSLQIDDEKDKRSGSMIHFPSFIRIAKSAGFRVISIDNMMRFYEDYCELYHEIFKGYFVYRKSKTISSNDTVLAQMFAVYILQKI
jgi:mRNA (guanine-N7-)-methyltransferase